jgi:predicted alpha/beta-fold hydrolase
MKRKKLKRILIIFSIVGLLFLHFYVPRFITEIKNPVIELFKGNYEKTLLPSFENNQLKGKLIRFKSFDQVELSAYLTYSSMDSAKGTVILLHGIRSNKESFMRLSKRLAELGYNSVALDSRAHGASKGTHSTFGVKEKKDVSELLNRVTQGNLTPTFSRNRT